MKKNDQRSAPRREMEKIAVLEIAFMQPFEPVARHGFLVDASSTGFLLEIEYSEITNKNYRGTLTLDAMIGKDIMLEIELMGLEIYGVVARTKKIGKSRFEVAIDFSDEAPEYWRECLLDMLPTAEEIEDLE